MERFLVTGGARLAGTVQVAGAKNSVLKLMAAALLAEGTTETTVVQVLQPGYRTEERVLRAARVAVADPAQA